MIRCHGCARPQWFAGPKFALRTSTFLRDCPWGEPQRKPGKNEVGLLPDFCGAHAPEALFFNGGMKASRVGFLLYPWDLCSAEAWTAGSAALEGRVMETRISRDIVAPT